MSINNEISKGKAAECLDRDISRVSVNVITEREIEIKFSKEAEKVSKKEDFEVYVDGNEAEFEFLSYFDRAATLRLMEKIDPSVNKVALKIAGSSIKLGLNSVGNDKLYSAEYVPYYTVQDIGSKSKIIVRGSSSVPLEVVRQAAEGINKMVGRSEFLTLEAARRGLTISIVGQNESVYMVPEYRELYNIADAKTRVTIPGTAEKPIIVTTVADVMRERGSDEYAMVYDFAKLFLEMGVKEGALNTPLSPEDDKNLYNMYGHLEDAYRKAKSKGLWENGMTDSIEEYFAKGTMIYYEVTPESTDGSWNNGIGPVSTRLELREYDRKLFDVFVEIYGEFEYISPYRDVEIMPWFAGTQPNRYGIDGRPLPEAEVIAVDLIADSQIEIKFNREVRNAEDPAKYRVTFIPEGDQAQKLSGFKVLPYSWNAVTLEFGEWKKFGDDWVRVPSGPKFLTGPIGTGIHGDDLKKGEYISETSARIAGQIKVEVIGDDITDWSGNSIGSRVYDVQLNPFIGQVKRTERVGAYVYADKEVKKESIDMAARYIDEILSNKTYGQGIADGLNKKNAGLAIIAYGNHACMQPDLRAYYNQYSLYVEGFGGEIAQSTEANINRDKRSTRYDNEFILGHEFGHSIHLTGIAEAYPELYKEINDIYEEAVQGQGLWPNSYAGSNVAEYFATLSNIWHSTMRESTDGTWNGTWGPVNTREELYRYDRKGFELMKKIYYSGSETDDNIIKYEKSFTGTPWESYTIPNIYDIDGTPYRGNALAV